MTLVDSVGWIEFFTNGSLAAQYEKHLDSTSNIVPTIILFVVYKKIKREKSEEMALVAIATMQKALIVSLTEELSLAAADVGLKYKLAMADSIVYATALHHKSFPCYK